MQMSVFKGSDTLFVFFNKPEWKVLITLIFHLSNLIQFLEYFKTSGTILGASNSSFEINFSSYFCSWSTNLK